MPPVNLQFGPYKTARVLGRGGMGVVYEAVEDGSGRLAALKVLTLSLSGDTRLRERFAGEIETLKLLKHPRIVELWAYGEQEGQLFYAMELVPGRSIQDEMLDGRRFNWRETAQIGVDVCDALRHAHDHGVVHRDLKPANLLLDAQGRVKLSDFGIAKMFGGSQLTSDGGVLGTADYMSPEQAEGRPATNRSDLYSLGSVLYAILSRRAPFESKTLPEVIHRLIHEEPAPLSRLVPDLPDEFVDLIHQLLHKDPSRRIPTALAVGKRLQALLDETAEELPLPDDDEYQLEEDPPAPHRATLPETHRGGRPTIALPSGTPLPGVRPPVEERGSGHSDAVHLRPTVVRPDSLAAAGPLDEIPPQPATRFTTIEKSRGRPAGRDVDDDADRYLWLKFAAIGLVLAITAAGGAYLLWPPSADTLYRQIASAATAGEPQRLSAAEGDIDRFLRRFADDERAGEVTAWKEELDRRRLRKRLELRTRGLGAKTSNSPVEKLYLDALQDAPFAPERAVLKLRAIVDLFGNDDATPETTKQFVELAQSELEKLEGEIKAAGKEQSALLAARLERADELRKTDLSAAQAIWRGIEILYADKPWAAEHVERARKNLAE